MFSLVVWSCKSSVYPSYASLRSTKTHTARLCPPAVCKRKGKTLVFNQGKVVFVGCPHTNRKQAEKGMYSNEVVREYFPEEVGAGS